MDFLDELEKLATNATRDNTEDSSHEPTHETIQKWQKLFHYTSTEALTAIQDHRANISRISVSDEHWSTIQAEQESRGHDRESYEYELGRDFTNSRNTKSSSTNLISTTKLSPSQARAIYTIKLEGPLDTSEKVREAAGLDEKPLSIEGESIEDESIVTFCRINGTAKFAIMNWLESQGIKWQPMFARIQQKAMKDFHEDSRFPMLGVESTLPQFRSTDQGAKVLPGQIQWPVWYFFYGTLAQPEILSRQIGRECLVGRDLKEAYVAGGKLGTWAGKYKALIDDFSPSESRVNGMACEILKREEEDALLVYETDNYEVVRCEIAIGDEKVRGCTFRFLGDAIF